MASLTKILTVLTFKIIFACRPLNFHIFENVRYYRFDLGSLHWNSRWKHYDSSPHLNSIDSFIFSFEHSP